MKELFRLQVRTADRLELVAKVIAIGAVLIYLARFLYIALSRMAFPFTLEWMEGGSLVQVSRILAGQPLYVRPSFDFIPQIYPPLYFYVSALASKLFGDGFLPLRFISTAATLGALVLIFVLVYNQSGSKLGGLLASGLFCATYELSGHWFDIARVDSLALFLLLLAAYFLLKETTTASILGGSSLALSCFTKQTMLIMVGVFVIYCLYPFRKNRLIFIGTALFGYLGGTLLLDRLYEGWYAYYIFHLPGRHRVISNIVTLITSLNDILFTEILMPVFLAVMIGLLYLFIFPGKAKAHNKKNVDVIWRRRAVWILISVAGLLVVAAVWFLVSLPSDSASGLIGPYSMARLLLIAGQVVMGIFVIALAIKLFRDSSWLDRISALLYGKPQTVPRLLVGFLVLVFAFLILLVRIKADIFDGLSPAYLQRLFPYLGEPVILLLTALGLWLHMWFSTRIETWFYLLLSFGLIAISWLGRLNPGGYYNVFMPGYAGISLLFGLGVGTILKKNSEKPSVRNKVASVIMLFLASAQFTTLFSSPMSQIPTRADQEGGSELVARIKDCSGDVYLPFHTYLAELAGKDGYAGVVEMGELKGNFGGRADPLWDEVLNQIQLSLDSSSFAAVVQDNQIFRDAMSTKYIETGQVFDNELVFWPVTGRKIRPEAIYEPIPSDGCLTVPRE